MMDCYKKESKVKNEAEPREPWDIYVSQGCKLRHVIPHCLKMLESNRKIVLTGVGSQIKKTISVTEIVKKNVKDLEQLTDIHYTPFEEIWEPTDKEKGLDSLKATRNVPTITISLLLKNPDMQNENE